MTNNEETKELLDEFEAWVAKRKHEFADDMRETGILKYFEMIELYGPEIWQAAWNRRAQVAGWVSVKERFPDKSEENKLCITCDIDGDFDIVYGYVIEQQRDLFTHWQSLPAAPERSEV